MIALGGDIAARRHGSATPHGVASMDVDVAGVVLGLVSLGFAVVVYARERTTRAQVDALRKAVEAEHGVRDLSDALVSLHAIAQFDPGETPAGRRMFDQRWTEASARVWGHLDAAGNHVPIELVLRLEEGLSSTAAHLDLLRSSGYVAPTLHGLEKSLMETLDGTNRLRAALKRRTTG